MSNRSVNTFSAVRPLAAALVTLTMAAIVGAPGAASATAPEDGASSDILGTYELGDGRILTVVGTRSRAYELDGMEVLLRADGDDRFVAVDPPNEVVTVVRSDDGVAVGITLTAPGEAVLSGERVALYTEAAISFVGAGAVLQGTVFLPEGPGPHPAVAIVHGAEFATRDTYRLIATHYARRGVAALIYDKRGTGESTGRFADGTFEVLAADAVAAVEVLQTHEAIDPDRVGLLGFSQGGWIIAMAAVESEAVAFLIPVSASGFTPATQAAWLSGNMLSLRGLDARSIGIAARGWAMMYSSLRLVESGIMPRIPHVPGFWFHGLDPYLEATDLWARVQQPVLGIWGETDCQVPAVESAHLLLGALRAGGNRDHTLRVLASASHGLHLVAPCAHELGGMHGHGARTAYAAGYLDEPAEWIHSRATPRTASSLTLPETVTESPLGWHQDPSPGVPWYTTFMAQVLTFFALLLAFAGSSVAWLGTMAFARRRLRSGMDAWIRNLAGFGAVAGLVGVVLAIGGIAELLTLGDVHADFVWGGPVVDGVPPMLAAAATVITVTVVLLVSAGMLAIAARAGGGDRGRIPKGALVTLAASAVLVAWAASWGLLSVGMPVA